MKKRFRILGCILLLALALSTIAGCASDTQPAQTTADGTTHEESTEQTNGEQTGETPSAQTTASVPAETTGTATAAPTDGETPTEPKDPVPVTGIGVAKNDVAVKEGSTLQLEASVVPSDADDKTILWSSDDESIATVSGGKITGVSYGETKITATTRGGGFSADIKVTVTTDTIPVTGIYFTQEEITVPAYEVAYLDLRCTPATAHTEVTFYSYNRSIALVNENGKVTGISEGQTTVVAMAKVGDVDYLYAQCLVTVVPKQVAVVGIVLRTKSMDLRVGQTGVPKVVVLPNNATNQNLIYESSEPSVVGVRGDGLIGLTEGKATVTVKSEDGGFSAKFTVTVKGSSEDMDMLDYSKAQQIRDTGGYDEGLRKKSTGEILFSPNLTELRNMEGFHNNYNDYLAYLRFSYVDEGAEDGGYTFPSFTLTPKQSKGDWVDFFLQGEGIDCGFCPVAGVEYNITLVLVNVAEDPNSVVLYGTYVFTASEELTESQYYNPSYGPGRKPGEYYIRYVPSAHGKIEGETTQLVSDDHPSTAVTAIPDEGYVFVMWSDGVKTATRSGDRTNFDKKITAYFTTDASNTGIPSMYIVTDDGTPVNSKNYEYATMTVVGTSDGKYDFEDAVLQIRGRGNSSWNGGAGQNEYDSKNSYRLKFDEKVKLVGVGDTKNKDWVLNSNKFDLSGLRNYLVWTLADKMATIPYVPSCAWVQLYVNGQYRGMYMVTELIETGNDRVEVDDAVEGTEKGFLIEFDFRGNGDDEPYFYLPGYGPDPSSSLHSAVEICIKSKLTYTTDRYGNKIYSQTEINAIKDYMLKCNEAVFSGKRAEIDKYIDIPSFIDMYIIEELSKDCDSGRASFFVQKNSDGKLFCTAPWDFDFGFGTYGPATNYWGLASDGDEICPWYGYLVRQKWFRDEVVARMEELTPALNETLEEIDRKAAELKNAADANAYFWNMYGRSFHQYVSGQVSRSLTSYEEHIEFLKDWTLNRWECLLDALRDYR